MKTIDEYIDRAKELNGFQSDRELSRVLGKSGPCVNQWRTKRTWPSDDTMFKLAEQANVEPEIALIDLAIWRTEGPSQGCYSSIKKLLEQATLHAAGMLVFAGSAMAGTLKEQSQHSIDSILYIMSHFNDPMLTES